MAQTPNVDAFRVNVFVESISSKGNKKFFYSLVLATYIVIGLLWIGLRWTHATMHSALLGLSVVVFFCSNTGKAMATLATRLVPWSKFGYFSLKIIGCESIASETPPHLFLTKKSKVGQVTEWVTCKTNAPGQVVAVWAGRILKEEEQLSSVGIGNGSSLVVMFGESRNASLRPRQDATKVVSGNFPSEPDLNFDYAADDELVPQFIYDMFSDDEDEEDTAFVATMQENTIGQWQSFQVWISKIGKGIWENALHEFGDSRWCNVVPPPPRRRPHIPPEQPAIDESDSDTEDDDETPSFLREMLSDSDDDDEQVQVKPPQRTRVRSRMLQTKKMIARRVRWLFGSVKAKVFPSNKKVKVSQAKDVITLDDDEVRYTMPCGVYHHAMSQSSLLQYARNQVLTEKTEKICCPVPGCGSEQWAFEDICEILRAQNVSGFAFPVADVRKLEEELSANVIGKQMNCQRCPQCEIALMRLGGDLSGKFGRTCFGCDTTFCWGCRAPWSTEFDCCMNPKCTTTWKFVAAEMLKNCPRKQLDHMSNVPTLRACPECGQLITHVTACKHMRCSLCTTRFCFICVQPQKNGNWQCGYDAQSCKLTEVQSVDALTIGDVARTNILERVPNGFKDYKELDMDEFQRTQEQFVADVMASVRNPQFFD